MTLSANSLWLIPALPLLAAGIGAFTRHRGVAIGAILSMAGAFVLSCLALNGALQAPAAHAVFNFAWFDLGHGAVQLGFLLDPLSSVMILVVTGIGFLQMQGAAGTFDADNGLAFW